MFISVTIIAHINHGLQLLISVTILHIQLQYYCFLSFKLKPIILLIGAVTRVSIATAPEDHHPLYNRTNRDLMNCLANPGSDGKLFLNVAQLHLHSTVSGSRCSVIFFRDLSLLWSLKIVVYITPIHSEHQLHPSIVNVVFCGVYVF